MWGEVNILSIFQAPNSYGLEVKVFWRYDELGNEWINERMTTVFVEQPPTPGPLTKKSL